jgi:hypothetical protein
MIKLIKLLNEEDKPDPKELGKLGFVMGKPGEKELFTKGTMLGPEEVDPTTGAVTTQVVSLPYFDQVRKNLFKIRSSIQPFKYSTDADIAKVAKDAVTAMNQANNLIFALEKMIEMYKKGNKK